MFKPRTLVVASILCLAASACQRLPDAGGPVVIKSEVVPSRTPRAGDLLKVQDRTRPTMP